jgi:hypothetical protein
MTYTLNNELLMSLLFKMEEEPTLRNRYSFWQKVRKMLESQGAEPLDPTKLWNYQVNIISGDITIYQVKESGLEPKP